MTIPEAQLETWSHQGPTLGAAATRQAVYTALGSTVKARGLEGKNFDVYLQGSYRNDTNIRGESDVDVVVELQTTFRSDISRLTTGERVTFAKKYPGSAEYTLETFRADVLATLRAYFGSSAVTERNKCINIAPNGSRLPGDVVVCLQYRKYTHISEGYGGENYIPGIWFVTRRERREIINYPKPHYENGVKKQASTNEWFKPTVRMFKNARTYMVDRNLIDKDLAPSYFLQCLVHNAPDKSFGQSYQATFINVLTALAKMDTQTFICENGQVPLFGDTPEQWKVSDAINFMGALVKLWEEWK